MATLPSPILLKRSLTRRWPALLALAVALASLFSAAPVKAATIIVNTTSDVTGDDGVCSSREAIAAANADTSSGAMGGECAAGLGSDTITIPAGTYTLTSALATDMTLNGAGPSSTIVQASATRGVAGYRVFDNSGVDIALSGLTVRHGSVSGDGGGILSFGSLTLTDCIVTDNEAGDGGGIYQISEIVGTLTLTGSTVRDNTASGTGGGIWSNTILHLDNTTVSGNIADKGGGIYQGFSGAVTVTENSVSGNTADLAGGGIYVNGDTTTLTDSSVDLNRAVGVSADGGGVYITGAATLHVTGSTVTGNTATDKGGGIYHYGELNLTNSTVSGNTADDGGGSYHSGGGHTAKLINGTVVFNTANSGAGIGSSAPDEVRLTNTIVANNIGSQCGGTADFVSLGHNLDSDSSCDLTDSDDLPGVDPKLFPLANYGGLTETHLPLPASPAIDAGDDALAPATDQRGITRPDGAASDIGAVERTATDISPTPVPIPIPGLSLLGLLAMSGLLAGAFLWRSRHTSRSPHTR